MNLRTIAFVLGVTGSGGAENQCRYLLGELHERGHHVELVYFRPGPNHERFEALGVPLRQIPARLPVTLDFYRRARALRRSFGQEPPDILHTWLFEAAEVGLVAARAWPRTRVVLSHRSSAVVPRSRKHLLALRLLRGRIDHVVANSHPGAEMFAAHVGTSLSSISVLPNGIPPDRVALSRDRASIRAQLRIGDDVPLVCSIGRIDHQQTKDFRTLFDAMEVVWSNRPAAQLLVVGVTPSKLAQEVGEELPSRVHVVGWQDHPADWLNAADVLAVHSRTEGNSNVANEALMLGLPVAATDTGEHPTLVRRAGGTVVPVARGDLLGAALIDLIDRPPHRSQVASVGLEALSMETMTSGYLETYERVLGGARRR